MPFVGSIIFEFIGVLAKWVFYSMINILTGKKGKKSFGEIWNGRRSNFQDTIESAWSNIGLGMLIVFIVCCILVWLG